MCAGKRAFRLVHQIENILHARHRTISQTRNLLSDDSEAATGLTGRAERWGALAAFELVRDEPVDGERSLLFRARHANATVYFRFSLDAAGAKITRAVWWHV